MCINAFNILKFHSNYTEPKSIFKNSTICPPIDRFFIQLSCWFLIVFYGTIKFWLSVKPNNQQVLTCIRYVDQIFISLVIAWLDNLSLFILTIFVISEHPNGATCVQNKHSRFVRVFHVPITCVPFHLKTRWTVGGVWRQLCWKQWFVLRWCHRSWFIQAHHWFLFHENPSIFWIKLTMSHFLG